MNQPDERYYEAPAPPAEGGAAKRTYTRGERLLLLPAFLMGAVVAWWWFGAGAYFPTAAEFAPCYAVFWGIYLAAFLALNWGRCARLARGWYLVAAAALLLARYAVYRQNELMILNLFAVPLILMLHAVTCAFDVPPAREWAGLWLYLRGWLAAPFLCVGRFFGAIGSLLRRSGSERARAVQIGLLAALPVAAVVLSLLLRADAVMAYYLREFLGELSPAPLLLRLLLCAIIAMLFYSFLYAMSVQKPALKAEPYEKCLNPVSVAAGLMVLLAVYAVFALVQFAYLTGLAGLPAELTYSEYAVRGFRELCTVAGVNLCAFAVCLSLTGEHRALRPLLAALLCATAMLLASALYRLLLYIGAYGLTISRILPLWFMLFLCAALALSAAKLFRPRLRLLRTVVCVLVAWYLCLNALNLDAIIAKSILANADRRGELTVVDANYLRSTLSSDADAVLRASPYYAEIYYDLPTD